MENKELKIVEGLAAWSKKYPRGMIYSMSRITMDDELIELEEQAKQLVEQLDKETNGK